MVGIGADQGVGVGIHGCKRRMRGDFEETPIAAPTILFVRIAGRPEDGEIELKWWTDESGAHISVRDTGIGIAFEHIPRLTERFYRVDLGRARSMGGSGLGLAIVKHALQRHGATLRIKSREGVGSTFTCDFPRERIVAKLSQATAFN